MLRKEDFTLIKTWNLHGVYQKDIAAEIGSHSKTGESGIEAGSCTKPTAQATWLQARRLQAHC